MDNAPDAFDNALTMALARWRLSIGQDQLDRLRAHFEAVVETNRVMNLTRITDPVEAAVKHYADSLAVLMWVEERRMAVQTVLDVGTGAGFPAVPLAVMRPEWSVTAIDATRKKIEFVRRIAAAIGVKNLQCEHAHSDHWHSAHNFDLVVCRAVTGLAKLLSDTARYLSLDGHVVAYKTASMGKDEQADAKRTEQRLGLQLSECYPYTLALGKDEIRRILHVYRKGAD